jgi:hypothetical protein
MDWRRKFRDLLCEAGLKSDPDAIRRFTPKRSSGERRRLDTEADKPQLRRCSVCEQPVIEGMFARMGRDLECATCKRESGPYAKPQHDEPPRAA